MARLKRHFNRPLALAVTAVVAGARPTLVIAGEVVLANSILSFRV